MTQSIFQKLRIITLSNLHSFLDVVKGLNSIGEIEQALRDLETARNQLDDQAASVRSDVVTYPIEIATFEAQHKEADDNIGVLLNKGTSESERQCAQLEAQLMALEEKVKAKKEALNAAQAQVAKYDEAVGKLNMTITTLSGRLEVLRNTEKLAAGKEKAAKALSGVNLGQVPDVDDVMARIRRREAVADNALDRELGEIGKQGGSPNLEATVAARLTKRRAEMADKQA